MKTFRFISALLVIAMMAQSLPLWRVADILKADKEMEKAEYGCSEYKYGAAEDDDILDWYVCFSRSASPATASIRAAFITHTGIPAFHSPDIQTPPPNKA